MLPFISGHSTYYDNIEFRMYFLLDTKYISILQNFRLKNYEFTTHIYIYNIELKIFRKLNNQDKT